MEEKQDGGGGGRMVGGGKGGLSEHYLDKPGLCPGASRLGVIQALFTQTSIIHSPTIPYVGPLHCRGLRNPSYGNQNIQKTLYRFIE